jgi:type VI protein secretion system component VasK
MPRRIRIHWLVLAVAILLTATSITLALYAPHGPDPARGLQIVLTATAVLWILWGQMVHARKREARADADEYLRLIVRGDDSPFRRKSGTR